MPIRILAASTTNDSEIDIKTLWRRLSHWEHFPLLILVIFTLALHFSFIMRPDTTVGDETFYVNNARFIIKDRNDFIPEHPDLGKLFIVTGIQIFGDNPFGWRFFSILFGTIAIILFYFICRKLKMSHTAMLFATFLFALDDMFFVHASLGWLDIYMVTFMLAGFLLYLHEAYIPMGIVFALSSLTKFNGGLAVLAVGLHWLFARRTKKKQVIISIITSGLFFLLCMTVFHYLVQGVLINPVRWTMVILRLTAKRTYSFYSLDYLDDNFMDGNYNLQGIENNAMRPWEWLLPQKIYSYSDTTIQYLSFISWTIQIFIIPAVIYMVYKASRGNNAAYFNITWFIATYLIWIPLFLITDRVTYQFYFLPTTGVICICIGMALSDMIDKLKASIIQTGKITTAVKMAYAGIALYLSLHLLIFIISNPALPDQLKQWLEPIIR